ncbi:MAG: flippase-like domain-containing protein [Chitinispirillales bacterium]|nr:flippase-like domain-containing protein [Chitinispirillales bacterium]
MGNSQKPKPPALGIASKILRALLVIAPIAWIYSRADASAVASILASVSVPLIAVAAFLTVGNMVLQGIKWWALIRRFVSGLRLRTAVSVHLESVFYAIALPSTIAQDVVKSVMLSKSHDPAVVWAASWLGRLIGLFSLLLYSAAGALCLKSDAFNADFRVPFITAAAAIVLLCALSFSKRVTRPLGAVAAKIVPAKGWAAAKKLRDGIYAFRRERAALALAFLISAVVQLLAILCVSLTVYAVSGKFYFAECLVFVPLAEIMAVSLPLTPGSIGIRETLLALLFMRLGFSEGQVASYVTISLMLSMTRVVGGAPAAWRMIRRKKADGERRGAI